MPKPQFDLSPLSDQGNRFPVFAAILIATCTAIGLWLSATSASFLGPEARGPFRLAGLILGTLRGPLVVLATPLVAAVLTPGLGPALAPPWQPVLRAARWGGLIAVLLAGWPVIPALLASIILIPLDPMGAVAAFAISAGGALRLMIPGTLIGALIGRLRTTRRAG